MRIALISLLAVLALMSAGAQDDPRPRITVYPRVGINEGVRIEVIIKRHPDNRSLRVEVDGPDYFRAFEEQLDGESARVIYGLWIDALPEGEYTVRVVLLRSTTETLRNRTIFCRGLGCGGPVE